MRQIIVIGALALGLSGCQTSGNARIADASLESVSQQMRRGKTTKADVTAQLGKPAAIAEAGSGQEQWLYEYSRSTPLPINFIPHVSRVIKLHNVDKKNVIITFDKRGIVRDYAVSASNGLQRGGLIGLLPIGD